MTVNMKGEQKLQLSYVIRNYRVSCFFVLIFIIISSLATVASSLFLKSLIDDYIAPILASNGPADFGPLFQALCAMAVSYTHLPVAHIVK